MTQDISCDVMKYRPLRNNNIHVNDHRKRSTCTSSIQLQHVELLTILCETGLKQFLEIRLINSLVQGLLSHLSALKLILIINSSLLTVLL